MNQLVEKFCRLLLIKEGRQPLSASEHRLLAYWKRHLKIIPWIAGEYVGDPPTAEVELEGICRAPNVSTNGRQ